MSENTMPTMMPPGSEGIVAPSRPLRLQDYYLAFPIVFTILLLSFMLWQEWRPLMALQVQGIPAWAMLALSVLLALLPVCICVVQNVTRNRQMRKLASIASSPVSKTTYYAAAMKNVQDVGLIAVGSDYLAPICVYASLLMIGFSIITLGAAMPDLMQIPSVILGGWSAAGAVAANPDLGAAAATDVPNELLDYQLRTFVVVATAFIGAYVYSLNRLLDRINNNDLYPISVYYYAVRAIIAVFVAAVLRHSWTMFTLPDTSALILVGFVVGMAPDSFIVAMMRRAFQVVKISAIRADPPTGFQPASLSLLMIDDLGREKIDRLQELGIDNAHVLSRQNPLLLWLRLPYELTLIVDWIGQAHLYSTVFDEKLAELRKRLVRNSFDLRLRLTDDTARVPICEVLGLQEADVASFVQQLDSDPAFARLHQVREAMAQHAVQADPIRSMPPM